MEDKKIDPYDLLAGIIKHIDSSNHNERKDFACTVIFNIIAHAGANDIEMLGMLECVKTDIIKVFVSAGEEDEEIGKLINGN